MQNIRKNPRFYALWITTVFLATLIGFGASGVSYSWWGFGMSKETILFFSIIVVPVVLFDKVWLKATLGLLGVAAYFISIIYSLPGAMGLGAVGVIILLGMAYFMIIGLYIMDAFHATKTVIIALIIELCGAGIIIPITVGTRLNQEYANNTIEHIKEGFEYSLDEATKSCEKIQNNWKRDICLNAIALREKNVSLCNRTSERDLWGSCIAEIAKITKTPSLCSDARIIDDLRRDFCWFDSGGIQSTEDCEKIRTPHQKEHCLKGNFKGIRY